ncbi:hypothetical protein AGR1B_pAt30218 [Agrobacterium fabacearum S56]|nr:hypothetical protein AGR1B_pAt30218 [Agrobacterium fabacearum S56]
MRCLNMDRLTIGSEDSSPSDLPAVLTSTIAPGRIVQAGKLDPVRMIGHCRNRNRHPSQK